jgi:hypothetical protein
MHFKKEREKENRKEVGESGRMSDCERQTEHAEGV